MMPLNHFCVSKTKLERFLGEAAYQHVDAYAAPFHYNNAWMQVTEPAESDLLSSKLAGLLEDEKKSMDDVLYAIGNDDLDASSPPNDPRLDQVIDYVQAELMKQGAP